MTYADDITITSTRTSTSAAKKYIQPYLNTDLACTKQNNLTLNPDKTNCTLFTPDHVEYIKIWTLHYPWQRTQRFWHYLTQKTHIHHTHIYNISVQAHTPLQIIKVLTATGWGKQNETLMATYKTVMRPDLEYASSIWVASCILDQH